MVPKLVNPLTLLVVIFAITVTFMFIPFFVMNEPVNDYRLTKNIKSDKRVAVCLSGQLRNYKEPFLTLVGNLFPYAQCQIFLCTDDEPSEKKAEVIHYMKPKAVQFGIPSEVEEQISRSCRLPNVARMFYRIYACNVLRKRYEEQHGFKYDFVVRCRPDIHLLQPISFQDLRDDMLYIPQLCSLCFVQDAYVGIQDQVAIGSGELMDIYANVFVSYLREACPRKGILSAELFLWDYLSSQKHCQISRIPLKWRIDAWTYNKNIGEVVRRFVSKEWYIHDWLIFPLKKLNLN